MSKKIFIIAGESSGDLHGSLLVQELLKMDSQLEFHGFGGGRMLQAGVKIIYDLPKIAALGLGDVVRKYFLFRKIFYLGLRKVKELQPNLVILIDYPGFNIRFAKKLKRKFPVIYYISPQVWAWGRRRVKTIASYVNKMLVLFPFEVDIYQEAGLEVEFVGHPLIEVVKPSRGVDELKREFGEKRESARRGDSRDKKVFITLMPGSRQKEIERILPIMLHSAEIVQNEFPDTVFLLTESPSVESKFYEDILKKFSLLVISVRNRIYDALAICDFALVASGTATLETAISLKPFLIIYKTAFSTYFLGKRLVKIPYLGLVNVVAGKKIVSEFIQKEARPETIAHEVCFILKNKEYRDKMIGNLKEVKQKLGSTGSTNCTAKAIMAFLKT